jgi:pyrimidine operon attenuation protein/uracil phosphoribosyltransferase
MGWNPTFGVHMLQNNRRVSLHLKSCKKSILDKKYILNQEQIAIRMQRMALEVAERNTHASRIVLAGIEPNGSIMAGKLAQLLPQWFGGSIEIMNVSLDKRHPKEIVTDRMPVLTDAVLLLVDDVANSGKTLLYALKPFLEQHPKKIQILVLVDRTHKKYPIHPDYVGLSLATTIQEYIDVEIADGELAGAWMA